MSLGYFLDNIIQHIFYLRINALPLPHETVEFYNKKKKKKEYRKS